MLSTFRNWSQPAQLEIDGPVFRVPFPMPQSKAEEIPVRLIRQLRIHTGRSRVLRRPVESLEVGLDRGTKFLLFTGYPHRTLAELTDVLGPALGLSVDEH